MMVLADAPVSIVGLHLLKKEHPEIPLGDEGAKVRDFVTDCERDV